MEILSAVPVNWRSTRWLQKSSTLSHMTSGSPEEFILENTFAGYVALVSTISKSLYKSNKCCIPVLIKKGRGKCVCQLWFPFFFPAANTSSLLLERQDMQRMWWVQLLQSWVQFAIWLFTFLQHAKLLPPLNFTSVYCCNTLIASQWKSISLRTQHFN